MNKDLIKILVKQLRETADKLESGNSNITSEEATGILNMLTHEALNKSQAADYLHVSRATFDNLVAANKLPKGRKVKHRNDLIWYKDELVMS